jgi:hypothetical protein
MVALLAMVMVAALGVAQADDQLPRLVHVPVVSVRGGTDMVVRVEPSDFTEMGQVELYYRGAGEQRWRSLAFARATDDSWVARVPKAEIAAGGMEYYIAARGGERPGERFATASDPQPVQVLEARARTVKDRELERLNGHRSLAALRFEQVSYAGLGDTDRTWAAGADFTYFALGAVRGLSFGFTRRRGTGPLRPSMSQAEATDEDRATGLDHAYAAIEFAADEHFSLTPALMLGAQEEFTGGGGLTARIGLDPGTHVKLHMLGIMGVGLDAGMELGWDTVPHLPMSFGTTVTSWPNAMDWGLRLHYQLGIPFGQHADLWLCASYQARDFAQGGPGAGAAFTWSF